MNPRMIVATVVVLLLMPAVPALAASRRFAVQCEPEGTNVEFNGELIGVITDDGLSGDIDWPDYYFQAPNPLNPFAKFLSQSIALRFWKDGYLPKTIQLTSGPFAVGARTYYVITRTEFSVKLERDPRVALPPPSPSPVSRESAPATTARSGTGFIVSREGYVATNYHVIRDATRILIRQEGGITIPATVLIKDIPNDLALLKPQLVGGATLPSGQVTFARSSGAQMGQEVFTLGYPLGSLMGATVRLSTGTISSLFGIADDPRVIQISNPVQPGNSGGPLLNTDGQLVGIVVSQLDAAGLYEQVGIIPQNMNFAVKASFLKNLVDAVGADDAARTPNRLTGLSREKQVASIAPLVVQVMSYTLPRAETDSRPERLNVEGFTPDQVRASLGFPSRIDNSSRYVTWFYDTPQGTLRVFFVIGRATLNRP